MAKYGRKLLKELERKIQKTRGQFYPEGDAVDFKFPAAGDNEVLENLYVENESYSCNNENREKQYEADKESILQIHQNVLEGKAGNVEVCFDKGTIQFENKEYGLSNSIVMMRVKCEYEHAFFKEGDRYDARIFIENASINAFLVFQDKDKEKDKDSNQDAVIISLDEFYLLGNCCDKKSGIMIGYDWMENDIYCELVEKTFFDPIRDLLSSDYLQEKWQKAKEANEKNKKAYSSKRK